MDININIEKSDEGNVEKQTLITESLRVNTLAYLDFEVLKDIRGEIDIERYQKGESTKKEKKLQYERENRIINGDFVEVVSVDVYEFDSLHIINTVFCNPFFLDKVYRIRKRLNISPFKAFYVSNGKCDKQGYSKWRTEQENNPEKKKVVVSTLQEIKRDCSIPFSWMECVEAFLLRGTYHFPERINFLSANDRKKRLPPSLQNLAPEYITDNYNPLCLPGFGYSKSGWFFEEEEDLSSNSSITTSRYSLLHNADESYSIRVIPGRTTQEDILNAWREMERNSLLPPNGTVGSFSDRERDLEAFYCFLYWLNHEKKDSRFFRFDKTFKSEYVKMFLNKSEAASTLKNASNTNFKHIKETVFPLLKEKWKGWLNTRNTLM